MVTIFKQPQLGAMIQDPISEELIHTMGALFVDDTDLYKWREQIMDPGKLWCQTQIELENWNCLLNATGGALKLEKCFWYLLDYDCVEGEWTYAETRDAELKITNPDGTKKPNQAGKSHRVEKDVGNIQFTIRRK
jgi:hypothetical protein